MTLYLFSNPGDTVRAHPIILMSNSAYGKVDGKKTDLVRGDAWILRKDSEKGK